MKTVDFVFLNIDEQIFLKNTIETLHKQSCEHWLFLGFDISYYTRRKNVAGV